MRWNNASSISRLFPNDGAWLLTDQWLSITNDGGQSWREVTPDGLRGQYLGARTTAYAIDRPTVWIARFPSTDPAPPPYTVSIYHSVDGGKTWISRDVSLDIPNRNASSGSIFFLDADHGWLMAKFDTSTAFSSGELYRTADAGTTWEKVSAPMGEPVTFATSLDGWMAGGPGGSHLYVTHDGGVTWEVQQVPQHSADRPGSTTVATPHFFDGEHGVLPVQVRSSSQTDGVDSLYFYVTNNGGTS